MSLPIYTVSQKRAFAKDPWTYHARYHRNLVPKSFATSPELDFGTAFHHAMHRLFKLQNSQSTGYVIDPASKWGPAISGYVSWQYEYDDLRVLDAEIPLLIPQPNGWQYGGVADAVARNNTDGSLWVVDWKTHDTFREFNPIYDSEQLALYLLALQPQYPDIVGGVIASVRINYRDDEAPLSTYRGKRGKTSSKAGSTTTNKVTKPGSKPGLIIAQRVSVVKPPSKRVSERPVPELNEQGYLHKHYQWVQLPPEYFPEDRRPKGPVWRKLVVTRYYYRFSEVELRNVAQDFAAWVGQEQSTTRFYRNPQYYHSDDPYVQLSLMERRGEDTAQYIQENFDVREPHGEIRRALALHDKPLEEWQEGAW